MYDFYRVRLTNGRKRILKFQQGRFRIKIYHKLRAVYLSKRCLRVRIGRSFRTLHLRNSKRRRGTSRKDIRRVLRRQRRKVRRKHQNKGIKRKTRTKGRRGRRYGDTYAKKNSITVGMIQLNSLLIS